MPLNKLRDLYDKLLYPPVEIINGTGDSWISKSPGLTSYKIGDKIDNEISVHINSNNDLRELGYDPFIIDIEKTGATINADSSRGGLYGIRLLGLLLEVFDRKIPTGIIRDGASLDDRGYMLDVSRSRIPQKDEFIKLLDYLCLLRINHLELYMEHTFAYKNHNTVWEGWSPLTSDDIKFLDYEARIRGIELIPNQNSFGHMKGWLEHRKYRHLAEAPDGFDDPWGNRRDYPFSLTPAEPEVFSFLSELYDELLPNFKSKKINVGLDETFDLGQGRSSIMCQERGKGQVYLDYLIKVNGLVNDRNHQMLFWADIVQNHPELIEKLPKNITAVEWGYEEDHDFTGRCKNLSEHGIPFLNAPGTSLWNTAAGRYKNACKNIDAAIEAADSSKGGGVLITDWGDNGHIPPPELAWPIIAYGAARAWTGPHSDIKDPVLWYCLEYLKADQKTSTIIREAYGILSSLDELSRGGVSNGSLLGTALFSFDTPHGRGLLEDFSWGNIEKYRKHIRRAKTLLAQIKSDDLEIKHWIDDLNFSAAFADYAIDILSQHKNKSDSTDLLSKTEVIAKKHEILWHRKYRSGGFNFSRSFLTKAADFLITTEGKNE